MTTEQLPQLSISSLSTVWLPIPVSATGNTGLPVNPTGDPVAFAFKPLSVNPGPSDWTTGSWDSYLPPGSKYVAKILVGPNGAVNPGVGVWIVWLKITDNPEIPVADVLQLTIT